MAVILEVNDLLAAAWEVGQAEPAMAPQLEGLVAAVEATVAALASALANHEGVILSDVSTQLGFGGLCATFEAAAGGSGSLRLHGYDVWGDWE